MNEFTRKNKKTDAARRPERPQGKPWALALMFKCAVMLSMIFGAFAIRVALNERMERMERQAEAIRAETRQTELEIRNLVAKRERMYSMKYVQTKIREYNLALRPTSNSQIRYLKRYDAVREDGSGYSVAESTSRRAHDYQASIR